MSRVVASRSRSLSGWLDIIAGLHPTRIELGLGRVSEVATRLRLVPTTMPVISVAGTNGKGSTVHNLENVYQAGGHRTGAYTSPHLVRYNERIRVDGAEVSDEAICTAFETIDAARGELSLSYFEFSTLAALWLFQRARVDVMLLEVGLGGRLDAVNIVDADVALIASIGLDHQQWLGNTLAEITHEKCGIMRSGRQAIYGEYKSNSALMACAREKAAPLWMAGHDYRMQRDGDYWHLTVNTHQYRDLPLPSSGGGKQLSNAALAIAAMHSLQDRLPVTEENMRDGLAASPLPGRFHVQEGAVQCVFDVAHNAEAGADLAGNLRRNSVPGQTICVIGMLEDKPARAFATELNSEVERWHVCGLHCARGLSADDLLSRMGRLDGPAQCFVDVGDGWSAAHRVARPGDRILVCGSFHTVAGVIEPTHE